MTCDVDENEQAPEVTDLDDPMEATIALNTDVAFHDLSGRRQRRHRRRQKLRRRGCGKFRSAIRGAKGGSKGTRRSDTRPAQLTRSTG
ncbi:hypothetical protein MRX96_043709 [Rhipicephalus microplus]